MVAGDEKLVSIIPTERQIRFQELEFYAFLHFFFINQLTELLTGYGEVFSVWFDGACGEGPNGKKQYYDWERYYQKKIVTDAVRIRITDSRKEPAISYMGIYGLEEKKR